MPPHLEALRSEVQAARPPRTAPNRTLEDRLRLSPLLGGGSPRGPDAEQNEAAVAETAASFRELRLEPFLAELDTWGFAVVPPAVTGLTPERIEALRSAVFRVAAERQVEPDPESPDP